MEIAFQYVELENWGEIPRQRIPLGGMVIAIVGENGSGKSTFVDGVKLLLGNAALEDNRTPEDYVREGAGHAYVLAGANNMPRRDGSRPWDAFGYRSDLISLCCFLQLGSSGRWEKSYFIVDGPFDPQRERKQYTAFSPTDYQKVMETMGCTRTFYRLMALDPDKVKSIIKQKPRELFRDILNITGDRTLAENLARHKLELRQTEERLTDVSRKLSDKQREVGQLLQEKREVAEYEAHQIEAGRFDEVMRKHALRRAEERRSTKSKERAEVALAVQTAREIMEQRAYEQGLARETMLEAAAKEIRLDADLKRCTEQWGNAIDQAASRRGKIEAYDAAITRAATITESEEALIGEALLAEDSAAEFRLKAGEATQKWQATEEGLKQARSGRDYPTEVSRFLERCGGQGIHPRVVADAIEFRDPTWQRAIESLLGPDRFCLIVQDGELDAMFDLVDASRYRSWVSTGYVGPVSAAKPGTALDQVNVTDPAIYGVIRMLERYELAADKEQARRIRERGGWAITPSATVWTDRGIRNIDCGPLYCGKETKRQRIHDLEEFAAALKEQEGEAKGQAVAATDRATALRGKEGLLRAARTAREAVGPLMQALHHWETEAARLNAERESLATDLDLARNRAGDAKEAFAQAQSATTQAHNTHHGTNARWVDLGNEVAAAERAEQAAQERMAEIMGDREAWAFAGEDVAAFLFTFPDHPQDPEEIGHWLSANYDVHRRAVEEFEATRKPQVDFLMLRGLEGKQRQLKELEDEYGRVGFEVNQLQDHLAITKNQHRMSVKRAMHRYLDELSQMARLVPGTTTEGSRLVEVGEDDWELHIKIGFDGKAPGDYFSRKLSGGQKAATSVMLLMAALKLDGTFSLMFLDEPAARLDDKRTKELGQLLRAAGAQIFLTVPTTANLLAMEWIDHVLITTKKVTDERYAPPIKVRALRAPKGEPHAQDAV